MSVLRSGASILLVIVFITIACCPSPQSTAPPNMVWIAGGTFWMGCEGCGMPDALPVHRVSVDGFWMDRTPVTNAEFERFVNATGYMTVAERQPDPKDFPGVLQDKLVPGSAVFHATSVFPQKRSSSLPRAAVSIEISIHGATS